MQSKIKACGIKKSLGVIEMDIKVTIGVCVKNAAKTVKTSFESISIQDYPHELLKLVIVDDGSSDDTFLLAREFAQETDIPTLITSSKGKGLGATRQIAVDNAEGDYIVWVDDDFVLPKDFIRNQVDFMEKNPNVGAARIVYTPTSSQTNLSKINEYAYLLYSVSEHPKTIGTGGAIFRVKALERVGGFDIHIKGAGEDQDVSRRIRESGWVLATNPLRIDKKEPKVTLKILWKKSLWYGYGNHFLFHKYDDAASLMKYFPPFTLWIALSLSNKIYRKNSTKKTFFFVFIFTFRTLAESIGFVHTHGGYG
jgi:cellulose synthase/poly-beta-1,6-N-acetylglucosamine synthase-like glycosyltransferase